MVLLIFGVGFAHFGGNFSQFSPPSGEPGSHLPPRWRGQEVQEQAGGPAQTRHQHHALLALPAPHGEQNALQAIKKTPKLTNQGGGLSEFLFRVTALIYFRSILGCKHFRCRWQKYSLSA